MYSGLNVGLLVLLLFGYEHVYVYIFVLYIILFNVFIIDFNMILTMLTDVLLNYIIIIQMQSPLFSSESFPLDFTVISYTQFFFLYFTFYISLSISQCEKKCCFEMERSF